MTPHIANNEAQVPVAEQHSNNFREEQVPSEQEPSDTFPQVLRQEEEAIAFPHFEITLNKSDWIHRLYVPKIFADQHIHLHASKTKLRSKLICDRKEENVDLVGRLNGSAVTE
ncbi:hypothetical protein JCGZ_22779 [Jatropha curcas]|uniref:Uncharacterized protein n=1 Tax=Jatropha curcas TaxID=180498 RepID=A0A067L4B9_JATCU|nr:uncharacterized protein LOC110008942 [Jatropha curcas]KDP43227.1 hypothetical protein JCGZ_22779 [Jatropha curcas]